MAEHLLIDASALIAKAEQVRSEHQDRLAEQLRRDFEALKAAETEALPPVEGALPFPDGFVGELAKFIYQQAPRPVPEVAIVGALGAMAGIAGRGWSISGTGLNMYVVLVARSAIGKEAMHSGITMLLRAAMVECPETGTAFDFSDYASGPALIKACSQNPCFVNVSSEIGHRFLAMAKDREPAMRSYRKALTDLYSKSGPNSIAGGITYSNQEANADSIMGVAFSLIGETTPANFYESITPAMMDDGFMSRFCVIEYLGERPEANRAPLKAPPPDLVEKFNTIFRYGALLQARSQYLNAELSDDARMLLDRFSDECDHNIRSAGDDEAMRQLWNRAHLKALRVSALLAIGDNPFSPVVSLEQAHYSLNLIRHGIRAFEKRIRSGDVGEGTDGGREQKVLDLCKEFLLLPADKMPSYLKDGERMRQSSIIPRKYLQQRTQRLAAFEKHKFGHTEALNRAIKTAITNGNLMEVKGDKLVEHYSYHGQAYRWLVPAT
jgi:hypothetical protein